MTEPPDPPDLPPGFRVYQASARPSWVVVAWMVCGGALLAIGGCGAFIAGLRAGSGSALSVVGPLAFVGGCVLGLIGLVAAVVVAIRRAVKHGEAD